MTLKSTLKVQSGHNVLNSLSSQAALMEQCENPQRDQNENMSTASVFVTHILYVLFIVILIVKCPTVHFFPTIYQTTSLVLTCSRSSPR